MKINIIPLIGLIPYLYSFYYNPFKINSFCILLFGSMLYTNCDNNYFRWLDIFNCFIQSIIIRYYIPESALYGYFIAFCFIINQWIFNSKYKNYIHVILCTWPSWYWINKFENIK